jgi:ankyrin repeat protein
MKIMINIIKNEFVLAKFSDPMMLRLLYHHGADPLVLNSNEQSSLHIACVSNRLSIVEEIYNLTQSTLLEIKDDHGQTPLSVTTNPDIIDRLISFHADISSLDNNHMNAIMIAVSTVQIAVVNRLLSAINNQLLPILDQVEKRNDYSIFLIAVQTGSIDMCSLLLTHPSIRWETVDKQRMNAFHIAAKHNHYELIEFLCKHIQIIDSNTDNTQQTSSTLRQYIDAQNEDGKTPLHVASEQGHMLCIKSLLEYNADILLANDLGQLPLHTAVQNGHTQCVELLIKACEKDMNEFQSVLLRRQSPLITACQNGYADIVKLLLAENIGVNYGIDFDSNKEENPLEIAIKHRHIQTIHALLEHPHTDYWLLAIRDRKKNNHQTPLRDMIRYMPDCAQHAFNKFIMKKLDIDFYGNIFERTVYEYKHIDDYFM